MTFVQKSKMFKGGNKSICLHKHTKTNTYTLIQQDAHRELVKTSTHRFIDMRLQASAKHPFYQNPVDLGTGSNSTAALIPGLTSGRTEFYGSEATRARARGGSPKRDGPFTLG